MLEWFAPTGKPIHCILTKADKLNRNEQANVLREAKGVLESYVDEEGEGFPFTVQLFSALKRIGIEEADAKIQSLLGLDRELDNTQDDTEDDGADEAPDQS
jgi:GTP-binding protein